MSVLEATIVYITVFLRLYIIQDSFTADLPTCLTFPQKLPAITGYVPVQVTTRKYAKRNMFLS